MSEYQYYEFQTIDRPLTKPEMDQLRSISSRAKITATSFVNEYSFGGFKGNPDALMEKHFDAFLYLANWGTHTVKLRLPAQLLNLETARQYCGDGVSVREKAEKIILTFESEGEGDGGWVDEDEAGGQLSSLISVRSELAHGDLRALYLGWLLGVQDGDIADDAVEPPVPAGLGKLSASLNSLAGFLRLDSDLIDEAAAVSPPLDDNEPGSEEIRAWVARLPVSEKDELLAQLMSGRGGAIGQELAQRMRRETKKADNGSQVMAPRRTVAALRRAVEQAAEERKRVASEKASREKAKREKLAVVARAVHLNGLAGKEPTLWSKVESLIADRQPKSYDQAVEVLKDLRDLAARKDDPGFRRHVEALRAAHGGKRSLIERFDKAGL